MVELGKALLGLGLLLAVIGAALLIAARLDCPWDGYLAISPTGGRMSRSSSAWILDPDQRGAFHPLLSDLSIPPLSDLCGWEFEATADDATTTDLKLSGVNAISR
jgi:hypothetical protein